MDQFSKFIERVVMPNQEAKTVAKALVDNVIVRYGTPLLILSVRGMCNQGLILGNIGAMFRLAKELFWPHAVADATLPLGWGALNMTPSNLQQIQQHRTWKIKGKLVICSLKSFKFSELD